MIGSSIHPGYFQYPEYLALMAREFDVTTAEVVMKWDIIHPEPERFDFSQGDQVIAFAEAHDMRVRGHTLLWGQALPPWVLEASFSREQWMQILCEHIKTVVAHYRGRIFAWDVVNEGMANEGTLWENFWLRAIGPDYIAMAFHWAHEADPQALLFYNEHFAEGMNQKSQAVFALLQGLLEAGVPVHGVGMQMHIWLSGPPSPEDLAANLRRLAELGLIVHITEMDVRLQWSSDSMASRLQRQATAYRDVLSACLQASNCKAIITWSPTDRYSWIPSFTGRPDAPLLYDELGRPKPAYYAILELLQAP